MRELGSFAEGRPVAVLMISLLAFLVPSAAVLVPPSASDPARAVTTAPSSAQVPLPASGYFTENHGQAAPGILYYGRGNPFVAFRDDAVVVVLARPAEPAWELPISPRDRPATEVVSPPSATVAIRFEGANPVSPVGEEELGFPSHFFLGNDSSRWATNVPSFREVVYRGLYAGIDLAYRPAAGGAKYEFRVHPGADPTRIAMAYGGADEVRILGGEVVLRTAIGELRDSAPVAYQEGREVPCAFVTRGPQTVGFECGAWDRSRTLVIDPLIYSTFFGGPCQDYPGSITHDGLGNAVLIGSTDCGIPTTPGAYDTSYDSLNDVFVTKLDVSGSRLIFSTYLGGADQDYGMAVELDAAGNVYVAGETFSLDFPTTPGALDERGGGDDGYVSKLDPSGSSLLYSTFVGTTTHLPALAVDSAGHAYVTGDTCDDGFPVTLGAFQTALVGCPDAFLVKLNLDGSAPEYGTLFGGNWTTGNSVSVDVNGSAYMTGYTEPDLFPVTPGAFDTTPNSAIDAFVAKFAPTGTTLVYSTFLGGNGGDYGRSIVTDDKGNAYVVGETSSTDFPVTPDGVQTASCGVNDAFVVELNAAGTELMHGTYLSGARDDQANSLALGEDGTVFVAGYTTSADFPTTPDAVNRSFGGGSWGDGFLAQIDTRSGALAYSTYLGGNSSDRGTGVAFVPNATVFVTGFTASWDFPITPGVFDEVGDRWGDAFIVKLGISLPDLVVRPQDIGFSPAGPVVPGAQVTIRSTIRNEGTANASGVVVRFHDGPPSGSNQIGVDQILPLVIPSGSDVASVTWTAGPPGLHDLCVVADPEDAIPEGNESNNVACAQLSVLSPPESRPDYVPLDPLPASPVRTGLSIPLSLSIAVLNGGNATATSNATLALFDESMPPFAAFAIAPITPSNLSAPFTATWTSPAVPGTYRVYADVDHGDDVFEWDESNNVYTWTIDVVSGPITSLVVGSPNHTATVTYVTSSTPLSFSVLDQGGTGIRYTSYSIDLGPWRNYTATGPFSLPGEGEYVVEWHSEDFAGNVEELQTATLRVDDTPPRTDATVGEPKHVAADLFVTSSTLITLTATDGGLFPVGLASIEYRIDGGNPTSYTAPFALQGEGVHVVSYRAMDLLGNGETEDTLAVIVDDTPPTTCYEIGTPVHVAVDTYVTSSTDITLTSIDGGLTPVGLDHVEYRVDGGVWLDYSSGFNMAGEDGPHTIEYMSKDLLGNSESVQNFTVVLDDTPPATTFEPATGDYATDTVFTFTATDSGSGVEITRFRIDGGTWTTYSGGFTLAEGTRNVSYYSIDNLNNTEEERWREVTVRGGERPPSVEANYKPVVAAVFTIVLAVVGLWSSRRRPWKGGKDGMAVAKAFTIFSLPFVLAEVATGVVSLATGLLSIPPVLGAGLAVDVAILVAGLGVAGVRALREKPPQVAGNRESG